MRKVLIFIGLKIAEIIGTLILIFAISKFGLWFDGITDSNIENPHLFLRYFFGFWVGLMTLVVGLIVLLGIGYGLYYVVKTNWKWADKLSKTKKP